MCTNIDIGTIYVPYFRYVTKKLTYDTKNLGWYFSCTIPYQILGNGMIYVPNLRPDINSGILFIPNVK